MEFAKGSRNAARQHVTPVASVAVKRLCPDERTADGGTKS